MTSKLSTPSWTSGRHLILRGSTQRSHRTVAPSWRDRGHVANDCQFPLRTLSQVRARGEVSSPWVDTGIAQGRVLSPLLFNLLVNSVSGSCPLSDFRFTCQLCADDLVILAKSEYDLHGMGPKKSAAMVFGPARSRPSFSFSQRTVVAYRLFLSPSQRCLDSVVALGRPYYPSHLSW